ncbi:oxygen-insensitive NAD(P)H nitroreductase [Clostridium sp. CAG:678]|nr:oxygen-insensitive NAD(P)H nitroreductase [Clostridium sp. CAG:678]
MNTLESIKTRRSIRKYKSDPVPQELLNKIIDAGLYAPSGMGRQATIILSVANKEVRDQLSKLNARIMGTDTDPFYGAPAVLIVLAKKDCPTGIYDGSLVMQNLMLAAHELGLGSCWIHRAKEEFELPEGRELLKSLGIEDEYEGIGHCIIGYADGDAPSPAERKEHRVYSVD